MGGDDKGGGGSQQTQSNSNSVQTSGPNPYLTPMLQNLGNNAWSWMGNNMNPPGYFPGGTVAGQSPAALAGRDTAWNTATANLNNMGAAYNPATSYLSDAANGKYLDPANNPQLKGYLDAMFRPQTENFLNVISPTLDSKFAGSGRTAGGAHFDTTMRGLNDLSRDQSDATAKLYESERGLQQGAAGMLPGVLGQKAGQTQNWLQTLQGVGAGDNANNQRLLDDQNAKYGYDSTAQLDWYNKLSQTLQGMYPGGQTVGQQSGTQWGTGQPGGGGGQTGQLIGGGIAAAGTIAAAFI